MFKEMFTETILESSSNKWVVEESYFSALGGRKKTLNYFDRDGDVSFKIFDTYDGNYAIKYSTRDEEEVLGEYQSKDLQKELEKIRKSIIEYYKNDTEIDFEMGKIPKISLNTLKDLTPVEFDDLV